MAAAASSEAAATVASAAVDHPSPRCVRSNRHHNHHNPHSSHFGVGRDFEAVVIPPAEPLDKKPMESPEDDGSGQEFGGNAALEAPSPSNREKKQAWRRPANGSVDSGPVVMGAASWPALSESAKTSPKSMTPPPLSASDSPKPIGDGSARVSNLDLSSTPNNAVVGHQSSFKRGGGGSNSNTSGSPPNGGVPQQSFSPSSSPSATVNKPAEGSQEDRGAKSFNWEHGSRGGSSGGDYQKGFRRGNNGGGSHHHNNYGNRRDQERGGYDGYHRGRDVHMQQRGPRPLTRPPPPMTPPFISPPSLFRPPFGNPVVYPDVPSPVIYVAQPPETFRGFPFVQHPTAHPVVFIPPIDTQRAMLLKQIDYYFSPENLCKDIFLRQNMDEQGWVPLSLIAGFNRVRQLTDNMHYILDTVRFSTIVELQGEKIRRRNEWMNWVLSSNSQLPAASGQQSPATTDTDNLAHLLQTISFGESTEQNLGILPSHNSSVLRRSASGNIVKHPQIAGELNQDGNAQAVEHKNSDQS